MAAFRSASVPDTTIVPSEPSPSVTVSPVVCDRPMAALEAVSVTVRSVSSGSPTVSVPEPPALNVSDPPSIVDAVVGPVGSGASSTAVTVTSVW